MCPYKPRHLTVANEDMLAEISIHLLQVTVTTANHGLTIGYFEAIASLETVCK
jgi:hypothetical protein